MIKNKRKIIVTDKINDEGIKLLKKKFDIKEKYNLSNDDLLYYLLKHPEFDVLLIRSTRKINKDFIRVLAENTKIKVISTVSSGYDNIDEEACKLYKINILNAPDGNYVSAAEHTIAIIMAIYKKLTVVNSELSEGKFATGYDISNELYGKNIGIIGVGRIGSYVAKIAKCLGMNIYGNDIKKSVINKYDWIKFISVEKILKTCDIVTVHTPLDKSTRHIINKKNITLLKPEAVLINCARGGIIEEQALYEALRSGKLAYAGIDVYENEPDIDLRFTKLNNVLLTPHIAGKTVQSHKRMAAQAAEQIINYYK